MRRVALVTGASRGIGRGIALELAREGWDVCVNYIQHQEAAESTVRDIQALGQNAVAMQADVADGEAVAKMVSQAAAELAPISLLVNNAGIAGQMQFQDISDEQWNRYLAVNLSGARNTIRAVLPHMLTEKSGCIINISSIWGLRGASCEVAYACTKAALIGLTRSLALELAPSQIRVNCVAPGVIETDMLEALDKQLNFREAFSHSGLDFLNHLSKDETAEGFLKYYKDRINVSYDDKTGLLNIQTQGFSPEFALKFNQTVLKE